MRFPLIFIAGLAIAIAIAPSDVDDTLQNSLGDSNVKVADAGSFAILSYVPNDDDDIEDNTGVPILGDSNSPSEAFTGDTAALAPSDTCDLPGAHRRSEVFNGNTIAFAPDDACASPDTLQKDPLPVIYPPGAGAATGPRHELYKDPDLDPATPNGPVECKPLNTGHHNEYEAYCCIGKLVPQYSPRWDVWNIDKCSKTSFTDELCLDKWKIFCCRIPKRFKSTGFQLKLTGCQRPPNYPESEPGKVSPLEGGPGPDGGSHHPYGNEFGGG